MYNKKQIMLFTVVMLLFLSFNSLLFYNQYRVYYNYYNNPFSGIVKGFFTSNSGQLIIFKNRNKKIDLHIPIEDMKLLHIKDSVYKPSRSKIIYVYRKTDSIHSKFELSINKKEILYILLESPRSR